MVTCLYLLNRATDKTLSVRLSVGPNPRGLARTVYVRCIYSPLGREIAKCTVMYGIYILLQPTLAIPVHNCFVVTCLYLLNRDKDSTLAHQRFVRPHMLSPVLHPHMLYFTSAAPTHAFTSAAPHMLCCNAAPTHASPVLHPHMLSPVLHPHMLSPVLAPHMLFFAAVLAPHMLCCNAAPKSSANKTGVCVRVCVHVCVCACVCMRTHVCQIKTPSQQSTRLSTSTNPAAAT